MSNISKSQYEQELSTLWAMLDAERSYSRKLIDLLVEVEEYIDCYGSSWMLDKVREALAPYGEMK